MVHVRLILAMTQRDFPRYQDKGGLHAETLQRSTVPVLVPGTPHLSLPTLTEPFDCQAGERVELHAVKQGWNAIHQIPVKFFLFHGFLMDFEWNFIDFHRFDTRHPLHLAQWRTFVVWLATPKPSWCCWFQVDVELFEGLHQHFPLPKRHVLRRYIRF